jgi:hypothetical protein
MGTNANRDLQTVQHEGESYLLLPRIHPSSYDIVRLKDHIEVGAVWLSEGHRADTGFRAEAMEDVSHADIRKIVIAGIRAGLFA